MNKKFREEENEIDDFGQWVRWVKPEQELMKRNFQLEVYRAWEPLEDWFPKGLDMFTQEYEVLYGILPLTKVTEIVLSYADVL